MPAGWSARGGQSTVRIGMETWARAVNRDNARNQVQEFKPVQQPRGANGDLRSRRRERQMLGHEFEKPEDIRKSPQKYLEDPALFKKIKGRSWDGTRPACPEMTDKCRERRQDLFSSWRQVNNVPVKGYSRFTNARLTKFRRS